MSDEALAQERARTYFRTKAALDPAEVRTQVAAALDAFDAVVAGVPAAQAPRRTLPDEWSVQEIVDHLLETYRPGVDELRCLLAGQAPPGEPIPAALQSKAPLLRPWPWLLDELRRMHRDVLGLLDGVDARAGGDARAPIVMVVNVPDGKGGMRPIEWVEAIEWKAYSLVSWRLHAIDHMKQARKVLAAA